MVLCCFPVLLSCGALTALAEWMLPVRLAGVRFHGLPLRLQL